MAPVGTREVQQSVEGFFCCLYLTKPVKFVLSKFAQQYKQDFFFVRRANWIKLHGDIRAEAVNRLPFCSLTDLTTSVILPTSWISIHTDCSTANRIKIYMCSNNKIPKDYTAFPCKDKFLERAQSSRPTAQPLPKGNFYFFKLLKKLKTLFPVVGRSALLWAVLRNDQICWIW